MTLIDYVPVINGALMIALVFRQAVMSHRLALLLEQAETVVDNQRKFMPLVEAIADIKDKLDER